MLTTPPESAQRSSARASRVVYLFILFATVATGLLVHFHGEWLPRRVHDMLGDALWASMIVWIAVVVFPEARAAPLSAATLAFCFLVEFSQLVRTDLLQMVRATVLGHLIIGSDFDPRDLLAYTGGVVAAVALHGALRRSP
jgi:hypothetical protein